ncbi:MAG: MogA/MoaB family molybdenum cofactor biosynthesis protein [Chloroflexota bacterium]
MLRFGILTVSDRSASGEREDLSGPALEKIIVENGWVVNVRAIVPDDKQKIRDRLIEWAGGSGVDIILTTGGTGFAPRDITPEATSEVVDRPAPGLAEAMRSASIKITPNAMLSRAMAGIRGKTLIINLPGSPKGAVENLEIILPTLPHAVALLVEDDKAEKSH